MREREIDRFVGKKIKARRTKLRRSQEEMGSAIFVSYTQVQKYERGDTRVGASKLYLIAEFLECRVGDLFKGINL